MPQPDRQSGMRGYNAAQKKGRHLIMYNYEWLCKQFDNPGREYRPVQIIHCFFPHKETDIAPFLDKAEKKGMGGFVVNVGGDIDHYLTDDSEWEPLKRFIEACFARGLKVWLYDELGFPSGAAGRLVYDSDPEKRVMGLTMQTVFTAGGHGSEPLYGGRIISAYAYPILSRDETGEITISELHRRPVTITEGQICWDLPAGDWLIGVILARQLEYYTMHQVPYVDLLRRDVTEEFLRVTHEQYLQHLGKETFSKLEAIFTDEPSIATHGGSARFNEKYAVVGWTDAAEGMIDDFSDRAAGIFYNTDRDFQAIRREFWSTIAHLYEENFFRPIFDFCAKNGIDATGHMYGEENLAMQIGLNATLFGLFRYMQMPGVDRLYCTNPTNVIPEKTASSAAHLYGRKRTMSESSNHFEGSWWHTDYTVSDMINSAFYQYQLGLTQTASYYDYAQPDEERRLFEESVGIASAFITNGTHRAPLLVLIPTEGAWERYIPRDHKYWESILTWDVECDIPAPLRRLEKAYDGTLKELLDHQFDFDLIDAEGLTECSVSGGCLKTNYEEFQAMVIFDAGITAEMTEKLRKLLDNGMKLYAVLVDDSPSAVLNSLCETYDAITLLQPAQAVDIIGCGIQRDVVLEDAAPEIRIRRSTLEDVDVFMLHNRSQTDKTVNAALSVEGEAELFRPLSHSRSRLSTTHGLEIKAGEAVFITVKHV